MLIAAACAALLLVLSMLAAWWSRDWPVFSLLPPGGTSPDMLETQRQDLHFTFFTIWAALLLALPALVLFSWRRRSLVAARWWLAFWTAALVVFLVHFCWAVWVIFSGDWSRILNTTRVSAPILDTVFAVWWCVDVLTALLWRSESAWVRVQRLLVHVLAFVLFFMGAAREGELVLSRLLGWGLALAVVAALASRGWRLFHPSRRTA